MPDDSTQETELEFIAPEPRPLPDPCPVLTMRDCLDAEDAGIATDDEQGEYIFFVAAITGEDYADVKKWDAEYGRLLLAEVIRQRYDVTIVRTVKVRNDQGRLIDKAELWTNDPSDGSKSVDLKYPITTDKGEVIERVRLRRPIMSDTAGLPTSDTVAGMQTISRMSGIHIDVLRAMYIGDFTALAAARRDFLPRVPSAT